MLVNVTFGPINTSSCIRAPFHSWTPLPTVTRSPILTSLSMRVWLAIMVLSPISAPSRMCAKADTRLPEPMLSLSHRACGWMKTVRTSRPGHSLCLIDGGSSIDSWSIRASLFSRPSLEVLSSGGSANTSCSAVIVSGRFLVFSEIRQT